MLSTIISTSELNKRLLLFPLNLKAFIYQIMDELYTQNTNWGLRVIHKVFGWLKLIPSKDELFDKMYDLLIQESKYYLKNRLVQLTLSTILFTLGVYITNLLVFKAVINSNRLEVLLYPIIYGYEKLVSIFI